MDAVPLSYVFSPLSDEDRWALERFVRKVGELQDSGFSESETKIVGMQIPGGTYMGGPAWKIRVDGPSEAEVKTVISDFRQLYTDTTRTSAMKVLKILERRAYERGTDPSKQMIDQLKGLRAELKRRKEEDPRGKFLEEGPEGETITPTPDNIVQTWFNGIFFHDEPELAAELERDGHMTVEMFRWSLQMTIKDLITCWGHLRELAECVLRDPDLRG